MSSIGGLSISTGFASLDNSQLSSFAVNSPTTFSCPANSCDGSSSVLNHAWRILRRQKIAAAKAARKATPPIMPPMMAPTWDRDCVDGVDVGEGDGSVTGTPSRRERPGWAKPEAGCLWVAPPFIL